jgi:hypothetical protein
MRDDPTARSQFTDVMKLPDNQTFNGAHSFHTCSDGWWSLVMTYGNQGDADPERLVVVQERTAEGAGRILAIDEYGCIGMGSLSDQLGRLRGPQAHCLKRRVCACVDMDDDGNMEAVLYALEGFTEESEQIFEYTRVGIGQHVDYVDIVFPCWTDEIYVVTVDDDSCVRFLTFALKEAQRGYTCELTDSRILADETNYTFMQEQLPAIGIMREADGNMSAYCMATKQRVTALGKQGSREDLCGDVELLFRDKSALQTLSPSAFPNSFYPCRLMIDLDEELLVWTLTQPTTRTLAPLRLPSVEGSTMYYSVYKGTFVRVMEGGSLIVQSLNDGEVLATIPDFEPDGIIDIIGTDRFWIISNDSIRRFRGF